MVSSTHEHHDYLRKSKFAVPVKREVRRQCCFAASPITLRSQHDKCATCSRAMLQT